LVIVKLRMLYLYVNCGCLVVLDQSFDIPDRTFHNLHTSWRLSSAESNTDVKELIPEFFSMHEFFTNSEGEHFLTRILA